MKIKLIAVLLAVGGMPIAQSVADCDENDSLVYTRFGGCSNGVMEISELYHDYYDGISCWVIYNTSCAPPTPPPE